MNLVQIDSPSSPIKIESEFNYIHTLYNVSLNFLIV